MRVEAQGMTQLPNPFSGNRRHTCCVQVDILAGSTAGEEGYANGVGTAARFRQPFGIAWTRERGTSASVLYVADSANHAIRRIDLATGAVSTLFGGPGITNDITSRGIDPFERVSGAPNDLNIMYCQLQTFSHLTSVSPSLAGKHMAFHCFVQSIYTRACLSLPMQSALRAAYPATVTAAQVSAGTRPTIYWPFALRTDSQGELQQYVAAGGRWSDTS